MKQISKSLLSVIPLKFLQYFPLFAANAKKITVVAGAKTDGLDVVYFSDGKLGFFDTEEDKYYVYKQTDKGWKLVVKGTLDDSDSAKIIRRFKSVQLISRVKDSMKAYEYVLFSDGCVGLFNMASKIYMIFGKDGDEEDNVYIKEWGKFRCWQYL